MKPRNRRSFIKGAIATGSIALWSGQSVIAAEKLQALTVENSNDTIQDIEIFRIKTIRMRKSTPFFVWTKIQTKNGFVGYGECYVVESTLQWIAKYMESLKGRSVSDLINRFYLEGVKEYIPELSTRNDTRRNMAWSGAIACLEIALWDILGKMANQPVHVLLGGAVRDKIPLYANHAIFKGDGPSDLERILHSKELGFDMFKWDPFKKKPETEIEIRKQIEIVEKARVALGPEFKIAIDAHGRWSDLKAPKIAARALEPLNITFFEEPVHHPHVDMFVELSEYTSIPLATGELMTHQHEVRNMVKTGAIKYLQPDVSIFGGIAAITKACNLADVFNVQIATHNWTGPITTLATLQFSSVIPNLFRQEWPHLGYGLGWETEIVTPHLVVSKSHINVPQLPGIGATPDWEKLENLNLVL